MRKESNNGGSLCLGALLAAPWALVQSGRPGALRVASPLSQLLDVTCEVRRLSALQDAQRACAEAVLGGVVAVDGRVAVFLLPSAAGPAVDVAVLVGDGCHQADLVPGRCAGQHT